MRLLPLKSIIIHGFPPVYFLESRWQILHQYENCVKVCDKTIEDAIGALSDLVVEGKIKTIGLSEVSATTLRKAHAVHPIAAVQTEYSLWTRSAEIAVLAKPDNILPILGTTNATHLAEDIGGSNVVLDVDIMARIERVIDQNTVHGPRYNATTQAEIDTEEFA